MSFDGKRNRPRLPRNPVREFSEASIIEWVKRRQGYPLVDVELEEEQFKDAIADAFEAYSRMVPRTGRVVLDVNTETQRYRLPYVGLGVDRVEYRPSVHQNYTSSPLSINLGDGVSYSAYPGFRSSRNGGIDQLWEGAIYEKMARMITGRDFQYHPEDGSLYIQNLPYGVTQLVVVYDDLQDYETLPVSDRDWIRKYTLAVCKIMLGEARQRYPIVGPAGQQMINRTGDLLAEGQAEERELLAELKGRAKPIPPSFDDYPM